MNYVSTPKQVEWLTTRNNLRFILKLAVNLKIA